MLPRPCPIVATILIASASALASATPPLRHQLPARATRLEFLGWSSDGQLFALRVQHGRDMGELAGADQLVLIQVHDTLTAQMVTSFRIERGKDLREDNLLAKAWAEARPASEWKAYRSAVKLISAGSSLRSPDGWSLAIEPVNRPLRGRLNVTRGKDRMTTAWEGFEAKRVADGEDVMRVYGLKGKGEPGPGIRLGATRGAERLPLLTYQVAFTYRDIVSCVETTSKPGRAVGEVQAFFAPKGSSLGPRALLALHDDLEGHHEEDPQNQSRYYLRALGPQIEVIVSPSGEAAARSLCQRLAAAGLPVTHLSIDSTPHPQTRIYHRGASGPARAQRVANLLGGQPSMEELRKPGWLDLVVVLGAP